MSFMQLKQPHFNDRTDHLVDLVFNRIDHCLWTKWDIVTQCLSCSNVNLGFCYNVLYWYCSAKRPCEEQCLCSSCQEKELLISITFQNLATLEWSALFDFCCESRSHLFQRGEITWCDYICTWLKCIIKNCEDLNLMPSYIYWVFRICSYFWML